MRLDDPFDDLLASLAGFHRSWLIYVGLELGLFQALRDAGERGMTSAELAQAVDCAPIGIDVWAWAADAHELATLEDGRLRADSEVSEILLDEELPEFLGGQFVHSVVASMDWSSGRAGPFLNDPTDTTSRSSA
jgi:hypothetical protein